MVPLDGTPLAETALYPAREFLTPFGGFLEENLWMSNFALDYRSMLALAAAQIPQYPEDAGSVVL